MDEILSHDQDPINVLREGLGEPPRRGPKDKRDHMSLVEGHLLQLGNVPRGCWEPVSGLLNEYYQFKDLLLGMNVEKRSKRVVWMDEAIMPDEWLTYQRDWINTLFLTSQSVEGRQADLMVRGMRPSQEWTPKTAASHLGSSEAGKPEAKKRPWGT